MSQSNRSPAKDALAKTIIWGGFAAAKFAICTAGLAVGLVDKYMARDVVKYMAKCGPQEKQRLWRVYEETGSIAEIFNNL